MECDHRGTIWAIDIPDCPNAPCPCGYECTRCGMRWDRDPQDRWESSRPTAERRASAAQEPGTDDGSTRPSVAPRG
jgi:hypothetical protein